MSNDLFNNTLSISEIEGKYMGLNKQKYILASVDENIDMLQKKQINDLTNILIGLKSEYDNLILERRKIEKEKDNIEKQIISIISIDKKTKKKSEDLFSGIDNIKEAIKENQKTLREELFNAKTYNSMINKLKIDIQGKLIEMNKNEEKNNKLKLKLQQEKLKENDIKEKYNEIYNKISEQKKKNNFQQNELNLQLGYYKKIIENKWMFINSAGDRYNRQKQIANEAKNSNNDKEEINKRHILHLLYLFDNFLNKKMNMKLYENIELEDVFRKIKLYSGTSNLKLIVDKIIQKDKNFNYTINKVIRKEKEKLDIEKRINELNKQINELKSSIVINISENNKEIKKVKTIDMDNKNLYSNLIQKDEDLLRKYLENQETYSNVSLKYEQVINNIKKLCEKNIEKNSEESALNINVNIDNSIHQTQNNDNNNENNIDLSNEENIINSYNNFLLESEKTIDILFLCHNKQKFINMLKEKEIEEKFKNVKKTRNKQIDKTNSKLTSINKESLTNKRYYSDINEMEFENDDKIEENEERIQQQIYNQYMNIQKRKVELFIKNEKENK